MGRSAVARYFLGLSYGYVVGGGIGSVGVLVGLLLSHL